MKRNHWVPQSYLRVSAADPTRRENIWHFDRDVGNPEIKPFKKVAVRFYLYAPKDKSGDRDYALEEPLSPMTMFEPTPQIHAFVCRTKPDAYGVLLNATQGAREAESPPLSKRVT